MQKDKYCQQLRHAQDIEATYLAIDPNERPEYIFISLDNGDGSDPTDEMLVYYLTRMMAKHPAIKMMYPYSHAAHASALNYLIELQWWKFKRAHIGQRFGQAFLIQAGEGRRAPTNGEMPTFFEFCADEMKTIYEAAVTISRETVIDEGGNEERVAHRPAVKYIQPLTREEVEKNEFSLLVPSS
jgi:hypothetical protein